MARPSTLTDEMLERVVEVAKLGVSYEDAAAAAGVSGPTWSTWNQRALEAREIDNGPPLGDQTVEKLREYAALLGLRSELAFKGTGKGGKRIKRDWRREVRKRVKHYLRFLVALETARPWRKAAILGHTVATATGRSEKRKTIYKLVPRVRVVGKGDQAREEFERDPKTGEVRFDRIPKEEVVETVPPSLAAQRMLLEYMDPENFVRRKPQDPPARVDPEKLAGDLYAAQLAILETVPDSEEE